MSVGLYMDVHVPRAITEGLRLRGIDVRTAQEDGAVRLSDPELLDRAGALGRSCSAGISTFFEKRGGESGPTKPLPHWAMPTNCGYS